MSGYSGRQVGRATFYVAAVAALLVDQLSKAAARAFLEPGRTVNIIPGVFSLRLTQNPGAAFGALGSWPHALILIGLVAVLVLIVLRKERSKSPVLALSLGLLLGGTVGNLIDRLRIGEVVDFLDLSINVSGRNLSWPTFNLADLAITTGAVLLVYHILLLERRITDDNNETQSAEVKKGQ